MNSPAPLEEVLSTTARKRTVSIGLPAAAGIMEHRFPLTPEAAGMLVARGFDVRMERDAARHIHYSDEAYLRSGVEITDRATAFGSDIVVYLPALSPSDACKMRRGALLLSFLHCRENDVAGLKVLLERNIITLALDLVGDDDGNLPFADILHEIDGRAAVAIASSLLADAIHGKGILLGGVAGVVPCEVMIIGSDIAACAAADSARGLGAVVRMFDDNAYRLREALRRFGPGVITSAPHPRVFESALRSADIVVATDTAEPRRTRVDSGLAGIMKRGVITFDLTSAPGSAFPSMTLVDFDMASPSDNSMTRPGRVCYINAGNAVPRTVAMAMSNTLVSMFDDILLCDGVNNSLRLKAGLRRAACTFAGKCVNAAVARCIGVRNVDINLFMQFS